MNQTVILNVRRITPHCGGYNNAPNTAQAKVSRNNYYRQEMLKAADAGKKALAAGKFFNGCCETVDKIGAFATDLLLPSGPASAAY